MVNSINDSNFETEVLQSEKPVLVDFWAEWCGPCRMVAPIVEEISRKYDGSLKVVKLNVDENPATAARFGITAIPTLIVFKNGQPVTRIVGYQSQTALEAKINSVL